LAFTDTKFDSLDFVVEVGEPQKEGVMVRSGAFLLWVSVHYHDIADIFAEPE
jgi:hypothetical protein